FAFVGGGKGKAVVEEFAQKYPQAPIVCLPYQPLATLSYSLSASDLQVVSMGDAMVGCVHPCKVYGALALGRPILYLGPEKSHVGDILREAQCGWQVGHGEVDRIVASIREA